MEIPQAHPSHPSRGPICRPLWRRRTSLNSEYESSVFMSFKMGRWKPLYAHFIFS